MALFFYDSYAVIEYLKDNPHYTSYFEQHTGILTTLNLLEIYYSALQEAGRERADRVFTMLYPLVEEPSPETMKRAMQFRLQYRKRNISYADCVGYHVALEKGVKFLTGDNQFKDLPEVEFVK
jgi:predicted nucleic acid-binding protein